MSKKISFERDLTDLIDKEDIKSIRSVLKEGVVTSRLIEKILGEALLEGKDKVCDFIISKYATSLKKMVVNDAAVLASSIHNLKVLELLLDWGMDPVQGCQGHILKNLAESGTPEAFDLIMKKRPFALHGQLFHAFFARVEYHENTRLRNHLISLYPEFD